MKFLVYGAGAVGTTIGGMLSLGGHQVTLIGRDPHMRRITSHGLHIGGLWGKHHVTTLEALTEIPDNAQPDWILLTVKSFATDLAAATLAKRFPKTIPVLHIQNGVGNAEVLEKHFGAERVLSAMIIIGFQVPMAGYSTVTVQADSIKIGRRSGTIDAKVQEITQIFKDAGLPVEAVADVQAHLWGKVIYNASLNPLGALLKLPYGELLAPDTWEIIQTIVAEAFAVLSAHKQKLFWPEPKDYLNHLRDVQIPATAEHYPSMHSDLNHARKTEIDVLNGAISDLGRLHGVPTPTNDTLVRLIHFLEKQAALKPFDPQSR